MNKLAVSSGTVVFELDNKIIVAKKPARWTTTAMFVTGLVTLITCSTSAVLMLMNPNKAIAGTLLGIGLAFLTATILVARYRRKINNIPWTELKVYVTFDFASGNIFDRDQQFFCKIAEAHLKRRMQLTSSAPALYLVSGNKKIKLVKGSPFSGGVSAVHKVLLEKGINKK